MGTACAGIRKALWCATPDRGQLTAAETFSTSSSEAAHELRPRSGLLWAGKWETPSPIYARPPSMTPIWEVRAYAGGMTYSALWAAAEADKVYQLDDAAHRDGHERTREIPYTWRLLPSVTA